MKKYIGIKQVFATPMTQLRLMSGLELVFVERLKLFGIHDE